MIVLVRGAEGVCCGSISEETGRERGRISHSLSLPSLGCYFAEQLSVDFQLSLHCVKAEVHKTAVAKFQQWRVAKFWPPPPPLSATPPLDDDFVHTCDLRIRFQDWSGGGSAGIARNHNNTEKGGKKVGGQHRGYVGFNTGNGETLSCSQKVPDPASCLAVGWFLSISRVESYVVNLYEGRKGAGAGLP